MKVLVTGANGQLGYDIINRLNSEGFECFGTDRELLDITNKEQVKKIISEYNPDAVIHCAAYTAVEKAEDEKDLCYLVNVLGTKYVAEACKENNAKMLYISSDYIFNGEGDKPFEVTDKPDPINFYGKTKYEGEIEVKNLLDNFFIVRISWVFGMHGNNFAKTMIKLGKERDEISVVTDQIGSPTYTLDISKMLVDLVKTDKYGIYHATNEGYCSWHEFACEIFKQSKLNVKVNPIKTEDYTMKAKRPFNSKLSKKSLTALEIYKPLHWKEAISEFLLEVNNQVENTKN